MAHDSLQRLLKLEQILALAPQAGGRRAGDSEPSRVREAHVKRIQRLVSELQGRDGGNSDGVDALTMRMLLNDYVALLGHLRDNASQAETHIVAASGPLKEIRRRIDQLQKLKLKRAARSPA